MIIDHPSPNHDARGAAPVDTLVLHYTGMETGEAALARMCDPQAKVSAHYMIEEDGRIFRLVPEDRRAWHAGVSFWRGNRDINARSIGIELVNPGHEFGYRDFPGAQIAALIELAHGILDRHPIPARNVVGHSDVAPARKADPGERFPWIALAEARIGLWPAPVRPHATAESFDPSDASGAIAIAQGQLGRYGYRVDTTGVFDEQTLQVLVAFQRHFRPARINGLLDAETMALIKAVAAACGEAH
ncbi:MAG TPA: N-acetylmuramoyl-L-alanine amidase [Alphaproteobacteria bacterium]|nr:N-acetylmuramoyl-L-alanine amidase [Alphaproteobacteria bacterium]